METLKSVFEKHDGEFLKFDRIQNPLYPRPDVCAFMLLDSIVTPKLDRLGRPGDMVCCAEHDEIWLDVDLEDLERLASDEQIRDLIRCGVRLSSETDTLAMFV